MPHGSEPMLQATSHLMNVINAGLLNHSQRPLKFILNDSGIYFFPASQQHRDSKSHGLSYEDDYRGNAVAGVVLAGRVEIRYHKAFSDERIRTIWMTVLSMPELANARFGELYYQGREMI